MALNLAGVSSRPFVAASRLSGCRNPAVVLRSSLVARSPQGGRRSVAAAAGSGLPIDLTGRRMRKIILPHSYKRRSHLCMRQFIRRQEGLHRRRCGRSGAPPRSASCIGVSCITRAHLRFQSPLTSQGFGWAIAKALAEAGAEISLGVWVRLRRTRIGLYSHRISVSTSD
jgi:hypothetical protein